MIGGRWYSLATLLALAEKALAQEAEKALAQEAHKPQAIAVTSAEPLTCWLAVLFALRHGGELILGDLPYPDAITLPAPADCPELQESQAPQKKPPATLLAQLSAGLNSPERRVALATSGSTGEPKLVWKSWQVLAAEAASLSRFYERHLPQPDPGRQAAIVSLVPALHIYGLLHSILLPLISGRPVIQVADVSLGLSPAEQSGLAQEQSQPWLVATPASWSRAEQLIAAGQVSALVSSAGAFGQKRHQQLTAAVAGRPFAAVELYGSTETGGLGWQDLLSFTGFTAFAEVRLTFSPDGTTAHSPYIFPAGQWPLQDRLAPGPDGRFQVLGRKDQVFKYGGKRYSLQAIAKRLAAAAAIEPTRVICDFDQVAELPKGGVLWGYIAADIDEAQLKANYLALGQDLPFPGRLLAVAELPRTALGKVSLAQLKKLRQSLA